MKLMEDRRDRNKAIAKTIKIDLEKSNNIEIILDYLKINYFLPFIIHLRKIIKYCSIKIYSIFY